MSTLLSDIEGLPSSETWTAHVKFPNGQSYSETFTHAATPPTGTVRAMRNETRNSSWKSPQLDKSSFKEIKKSGLIKMSNYDVGTSVESDFIVRIPRCAYTYVKRGAYTMNTQNTAIFDVDTHLFDKQAPYVVVGDLRSLRASLSSLPYREVPKQYLSDVDDAIQSVMGNVVSQLNSSYDPLTDLAELRDTLETLHGLLRTAINPLQSFRSLLMRIKNPKEIGDAWMQYRYGIMPIIYSVKDIMEAMRRIKLVYHTERSSQSLNFNLNSKVGDGAQFYETLSANFRISGVGRQKPSDIEILRLIDNLSINPFKTAWELVPFSFVVDWFVNVGNFIEAQTGALMNFSSQRGFCYAVKTDLVRSIYYHDYFDDRRTLSTGPWIGTNGVVVFPKTTKSVGLVYNADYLLQQKTERSYSRRVFSPHDVELKIDPFLNWKRWIDAFVLSLGNTRRLLRG